LIVMAERIVVEMIMGLRKQSRLHQGPHVFVLVGTH
jgi:hypothetical protein